MKNKFFIIGIILFLILANSIMTYASTENTVVLQAEKTEVKVGETFKVNLKVLASDGINGVVAKYNYDTEKLELVEKQLLDSTNFTELGGVTNEITIMFNPSDPSNFVPVTQTEIYEMTFKLKDGVKHGTTAYIGLEDTYLSVLAAQNSDYKPSNQEITITAVNEGGANIEDSQTTTSVNKENSYGTVAIYIVIGVVAVIVVTRITKFSKNKRKK